MQRVEASETWKLVGLGAAVKIKEGEHIDPGRLISFAKNVGAFQEFESKNGQGVGVVLFENGVGPKSQTPCLINEFPSDLNTVFKK